MPVRAEYIKQRLYLSRWTGLVLASEVRLSQEQVISLREAYQDKLPYVLILDVSKMSKVQLDFQLVRNVLIRANNQLLAQVIVGASHSARIAALGFGTAFHLKYCFANTVDEALPYAKNYLQEAP